MLRRRVGAGCRFAGAELCHSDHGGLETIRPYVDEFIDFARRHPHLKFLVTEIGCGIAGFTPDEIAPLFAAAASVENIWLPARFWEVLTR